jgi:hypothetical protein
MISAAITAATTMKMAINASFIMGKRRAALGMGALP